MSEDRSLDEFAPGDPDDSEADATDDAGDGDNRAGSDATGDAAASVPDEPDDADGVEPASATSTWHTDGAECERCGARVERRWRDDDTFVCADCAPW